MHFYSKTEINNTTVGTKANTITTRSRPQNMIATRRNIRSREAAATPTWTHRWQSMSKNKAQISIQTFLFWGRIWIVSIESWMKHPKRIYLFFRIRNKEGFDRVDIFKSKINQPISNNNQKLIPTKQKINSLLALTFSSRIIDERCSGFRVYFQFIKRMKLSIIYLKLFI